MELKTFNGISRLVITDRVLMDMPDHMRDGIVNCTEFQRWIWLLRNPVLQFLNSMEKNDPEWKQWAWFKLWEVLYPLTWVMAWADNFYHKVKKGCAIM